MRLMNDMEIDRCIRWALPAMLGGILLAVCDFIMSGFMLCGFGVMAATVSEWRTEPGLWMLSGLHFLIQAGIYAMFVYSEIAELAAGRAVMGGWMALDCSIGTAVLARMVWFLWSVTRLNRLVPTKE